MATEPTTHDGTDVELEGSDVEQDGVDAELEGADVEVDSATDATGGATGGAIPDDGEYSDVGERVRDRSESIADREVARALRKLEARGDLTDGQRRAVEAMADGIVESLVAAPAETVAAASEADDETLRTVVDLFDPGDR